MFFRHNANTTRFVDTWLAALDKDPKYWDQNAFNDLARAGWDPATKVSREGQDLRVLGGTELGVWGQGLFVLPHHQLPRCVWKQRGRVSPSSGRAPARSD